MISELNGLEEVSDLETTISLLRYLQETDER